ncbi:hypothetical protein [Pseudomonas sp. R4-75]|uniref:hypothetical protein n=1 Tax=Pseudomonas sp. R4-75 TaxID=2817404 RepID=UPI003DAA1A6C
MVEDELRRWWSKRDWWPHPDLLDTRKSEDETALVIMSGYGVPAFAGFDCYACAHIERALFEYRNLRKVTIWRAGDHPSEYEEFTPMYGHEGSRPWMSRLTIRSLNEYDAEHNPKLKAGDLVVEWHRCSLNISSNLPSRRSVNIRYEAEGLDELFSDHAGALAMAQTIAFWQNTMHPIRRLILIVLYLMSGVFFTSFVVLQLQILLPKMF